MKLLIKLAWRNIWRNKRRSILTLAAITFATFAAVAMRGFQLGTYGVNIKNAVEMFNGYIQIQREGYQKNPSLHLAFNYTDEVKTKLIANDEIISFSPRIQAAGLIGYKDNSFGTVIFGIDPGTESNTTKIMEKLETGEFFCADTSLNIVIGDKLLNNLEMEIGDTVVVLGQGFDGSLGNMKFKVTGTIKTGSPELDQMAVFMGISTAQELLSLYGNRIHSIAIKLESFNKMFEVREVLSSEFTGSGLAVLTWEEVMPDFKQSIELDNISGILMLLILIIIVAFGILNTVLMSVTERFNEFGVTLSIGMPQLKLVYLILIETFFIAIVGILIGDLIGAAINYYFIQNPIEFGSEYAYIYEEYGFLPRIESSLDPMIFINNTLMILAISIASCLYPLYKVFKLEPLKGIRYT
ncbi:MAG: ABC transporter permease [Melioribacteraceae bacterium]|nr:ABC transporter permease [Melioribacteraceae bacterium]